MGIEHDQFICGVSSLSTTTNLERKIHPTPIPAAIMSSVAIDLFDMPLSKFKGTVYDTMVVCVDRLPGWMVAVPEVKKGLTGAKVAQICRKTSGDRLGFRRSSLETGVLTL